MNLWGKVKNAIRTGNVGKKISLLFVGGLRGVDAQNYVNTFIKMGYGVTALNIHRQFFPNQMNEIPELKNIINLYQGRKYYPGLRGKIIEAGKMLLDKLRLYEDKEIKTKISKTIVDNKINVIYCHWGVTVVPLIATIKDEFPNLPVIHEILTYPSSTNRLEIAFQNFFYGMVVKKIDGRIHCSQHMYNYLDARFNLKQQGNDLIRQLYFSQEYFYKKRLPLLSERDNEPHLIFIGRTDFSRNRPRDDVRAKVYEIARENIHFWLPSPACGLAKGDYVHVFPRFNPHRTIEGTLSTFMTRFDACIYLHNIRKKYAMYENSLQTRFLFAFTAGIPIVLPDGYYQSCQEIVEKYRIGFAYKDVKELKAKLSDRKLMAEYRKNAIELSPHVTFENNFEELDKFIKSVANRE